jgi:hypothetical protein
MDKDICGVYQGTEDRFERGTMLDCLQRARLLGRWPRA